MRIAIVGGGPAGLYFSLLMKKQDPARQVTVIERDGPDDTFGWGIVFSDQTFDYLRESDRPSFEAITAACVTWDNVDVVHRGERITVGGNRFSGIARIRFLRVLQERARALGVELQFRRTVSELSDIPPSDLLVAADGANSTVRRLMAPPFEPEVGSGRNKYIWLGTPKLFHGLTLTFVDHPTGVYAAHSYKFDDSTSTFIVECSEETWRAAGLDAMGEEPTRRWLEDVFRDHLDGEPLLTKNFVKWLNFPLVRNRRWSAGHAVLLGDALHTAHFSIGSGTKLALEDAIALAQAFDGAGDVPQALAAFERNRRPRVEQYQQAALDSLHWFESVSNYMHLDPMRLTVSCMTRSNRIDVQKLRQRDPEFVARALAAGALSESQK